MPQNLELKASIASVDAVLHRAHRIRARNKGMLHQRDIYYNVPRGRLKLRITHQGSAELIYYVRLNKEGSKYSEYIVVPISNIKLIHTLCSKVFGRKVIVDKKRRLYLYKNARIHIDTVKGLGNFLEFEVKVTQGKRQARQILKFLSKQFGIDRSSMVAISYSDLMLLRKHRFAS